jgi:hypothetical protein
MIEKPRFNRVFKQQSEINNHQLLYFWHRGQYWLLRPPITIRFMGVLQTRQGSPSRP